MNLRKFCSVALALSTLVLAPAAVAATLAYTVAVALPLDNPEAINNRGDFVGFNGITTQAFIYADGVRTELGTLGGPTSIAYGINNKRVIVSESTLPSGLPHAFVDYGGVMRDIGTVGGLTRVHPAPRRLRMHSCTPMA